MEEPKAMCDMIMPKFIEEGYDYIGKDGQMHIKDNAPNWAKREFEEFYVMINSTPNEEGGVTQF